MKALSTIYLDGTTLQGTGWKNRLDHAGQGLPPAAALIQALDPSAFETRQAALLIEDGLLFPLRVQLDEAVKAKELGDFLKWKLKRLLPYPVDQVQVRYVPLAEENTYLTFSLPSAWINAVHGHFHERGVQLGYSGGLFSALLENNPVFRGRVSVAFFAEMYVIAELDNRGGYRRFHSRRVPFGADESIDLDTVLRVDLQPLLDTYDGPVLLLNLAPGLAGDFADLAARAASIWDKCTVIPANGDILARYHTVRQVKAVPA